MSKKDIFTDRSVRSVNLLLKEIKKYPLLSKEEECSLWERMQNGSKSAREKLICCNLRYVVTMAKKYLWSGIALEDLINTGAVGLTMAADRFDATRGHRFLSYGIWYVESELKKAVTGHWPYKQMCSLDVPDDPRDGGGGATLLDLIPSDRVKAPDWAVTYLSELAAAKERVRKQFFDEAASIFEEAVIIKNKGLFISDLSKKHGVSESDVKNLLRLIGKDLKEYFEAAA